MTAADIEAAETQAFRPCPDCWHESHPLRRCPEIVGSSGAPMPDPVYCECADVGAMAAEIRRLTAAARNDSSTEERLSE